MLSSPMKKSRFDRAGSGALRIGEMDAKEMIAGAALLRFPARPTIAGGEDRPFAADGPAGLRIGEMDACGLGTKSCRANCKVRPSALQDILPL